MGDTSIQWTQNPDGTPGKTLNPVSGCSVVSPGCEHCYAETISHRFGHTTHPWTARWAAENVQLHPERLLIPFGWKRPQRCFLNSMSDMWHDRVPDYFLVQTWAMMALTPQHTYMILTKRPERMRTWLSAVDQTAIKVAGTLLLEGIPSARTKKRLRAGLARVWQWPLPNVWLGTSVEDQRRADERIPLLLQTPAAIRFLSVEPMLGPVDLLRVLYPHECPEGCGCRYPSDPDGRECACDGPCCTAEDWPADHGLHWAIFGGESGPAARPMDLDWLDDAVSQCREAGVAPFVKQMGTRWAREHRAKDGHGGDPEEWEEWARVREWPRPRVAA